MIFGAFGFIPHRPIHEDQNQGMKDMHPWNVDLHSKPEMGRVKILLIGLVGGWYRVNFIVLWSSWSGNVGHFPLAFILGRG